MTATRSQRLRTTLEVVADEEIGQAELGAQVHQQVDDLGLDRDVEGRDRLVADHEVGLQGQGAGDADALALAAAHLVRIAAGEAGRQAAERQQLAQAAVDLGAGDARLVHDQGSPTMSRTVMRGLSEE